MTDSHEPAGFIAPEPADLAPLFPGYEIQRLIATGGMGAVYCAVQKSLDRTVALKILPLELSQDAAFCKGFETEAKAMARLNHPNLIGVYDFGEVNGMLYIVMEFVPGQSIYHSAHGHAIDPAEVIRLISAICHGLAHAHENGIIHRDIKPANILLDLNAQPKIGDFGLARPIERKIEEGEEIFGTPHYTAPEVVDFPHSVDYRADIFSVGVMLHELLTGKLPADDLRPASLIARCDVRFDAIIKRATQPLPATRYASAEEMAKDLQAIVKSQATTSPRSAGPPRPSVRRPRQAAARKKSSSFPGILMLLLAVGIGVYSFNHFRKNQSPKLVILQPAPAKPPLQTDPEPEPEPVPEVAPQPSPMPEASVPEPAPEAVPEVVEEVVTAAPKSDVAGFFEKARKIMRERAAPLIKTRNDKLKNNVTSLRRDIERAIRKDYYSRDTSEAQMEKYEVAWKKAGNRIPPTMIGWVAGLPTVTKIYNEHLEKQTEFDAVLQTKIAPLAETYTLGLTKQIERLKTDNDVGAITLIEEEIALTHESPEYFLKLMNASETEENE